MSKFEDKINEMLSASNPQTSLELEWYYDGYRTALREALNVFKETGNED